VWSPALLYFVPVGLVLTGILSSAQGVAVADRPSAERLQSSGLPFPASFTNVARQAGLTGKFVQGNPANRRYIVEANGTGVAMVDYDNDGQLDIFLVNGSRFEKAPPGVPPPANYLYRNQGNGSFQNVTTKSGVGRSGWGNGVCAGDFDNDGFTDLYVTYWGHNSLFRNTGSATFADIAAAAGVAGSGKDWSTGCTFVDVDRDGRLDLFVVTYAGFDLKTVPLPGQMPTCKYRDKPVFCGPRGLPHGRTFLYRNNGDGTFADVSVPSGVSKAQGFYGFTTVGADFNGDGWQDIYVACDSTPSLLFRNNRNGTFSEVGTESGVAFNENGTEQAGMGLAVADVNGDGTLDIVKTNFIHDYPNLYRNLGKGFFEDHSARAGLGVNPQYLLWGAGLEDFDNDGLRDLFLATGHVFAADSAEPWATPNLLYRQVPEGRFEDVSAIAGSAIAERQSSRGAAFGDFDNDGDVDIVIMNMDNAPTLLRNDLKSTRHWLNVRLQGVASNRSAIGAIVSVESGGKRQTSVLLSQASYLSVNDFRIHFGLGNNEKVDGVTVRWPSGATETFNGIRADRTVLLKEGSSQ
jgi:enediyne biosynthesis protein E4